MGRAKIIPAKDTLFLPYQERWIKDRRRIKLMEKSRQIGISWATAYDDVRDQSKETTTLDSWGSSRDDIQARLYVEDCKKFAELLHIACSDMETRILDTEGTTSYVLKLANGTRIHSMSSNPDAQAGKRGSRLLDEFALHKDPRKMYAIAYPGITWGGQLKIVSTHRGSHNFFNELVTEIKEKGNKKKISLHTVTLQNALDQGFLYKLQCKLSPEDERQEMDEAEYFDFIRCGCADEESFLQEYMCVPADDNSAFLEYQMITACEYTHNPETVFDLTPDAMLREAPVLYAGVDVGRKKDLTVLWINAFEGERHLTRRVIEMQNTKFSDQEKVLYDFLELPNLRRCCIDATGIGMQLAERAQDRFGKYKVEAVNFSGPVKEELAYPVKAAFEDLNVRIPESKYIRSDLRAIKKETTAANNIRFSADRSENGHSDRFWALALAIHARGKNDGPCRIAAFGREDAAETARQKGHLPLRPDHSSDPITRNNDRRNW